MIVVSIIGTDRFTAGYGPAKIAHEQAHLSGPIPVRVLRAAQVHELVAQLVDGGIRGEVAYVPRMRTQLVAARAVAEVLADLATAPGPGTGPFLEVAGPRKRAWSRWRRCSLRGAVTRRRSRVSATRPTRIASSTRTVPCCPALAPS